MPTGNGPFMVSRRQALLMLGAGIAAPGLKAHAAGPARREIPASGESLPVLGLGTWQVFDTAPLGADFEAAADTLRTFVEQGGRLIDSSPMYGQSEARVGDIVTAAGLADRTFIATKIWTRGEEAGRLQLAQSQELLRRRQLDLVQVHNLLDVDAHWRTLQAAREAGAVRYLGLTHYQASAHRELEDEARRLRPEFIQVNYSLAEPEAGGRLLPFARDVGIAVLVNRPFTKGAMIDRARGRPLPPQAVELGCRSAAQLFLKWVLADAAVTVVLTGTRNPRHARENVEAAAEPFPDAAQRRAIADWFVDL